MSQKSENFQLKTLRQNSPTPLHAADLQFQAFAEFDCSRALPDIQVPTLVLTGDLDQLISPQNSRIIASLIPGARLIIIPGCGHRLMWEATDECVAFVTEFLTNVYEGRLDSAAVSLTLKNRSDRTAIRRSQRTQLRAGRQCHLLPLSTSGEFLLSGGRLNVLNDPRLDVQPAPETEIFPPWQHGKNNDATNRGFEFAVPQVKRTTSPHRRYLFLVWLIAVLRRLGDTLAPLALVSVGLQLRLDQLSGIRTPLSIGIAFKLLVGPALVMLVYVGLLRAAGNVVQITLFESAMGPMIGASIVAIQHGLNPPLITLLVGLGITASFLSLPIWWYVLQGI